ncbi:MAG TPA: ABC transporter ATP-binding protein [candidate division Zixibacteria bacterium]|nr:ABC transporter ATP-binding protein [candidate division Zixibacteria bacterium]
MISFAVNNLAKRFGPRGVFRDLTFEVTQGQTIAITGPNGSGKSTLSKILMGLLPPSAGAISVTLNGAELTHAERMRHMAAVTPYFNLYEALTGYENFLFFARLRDREFTTAALDDWLLRFGLGGRGADMLGEYSSGMRQRLKFAIALALDPEILFVDEPASNLDQDGKSIVFREISALKQSTLIFWATNEPEELSYADKVVRLA